MHNLPELALDKVAKRPVSVDFSVIIPTLGRPILKESLYWIACGSRWPAEVIVVDQSSSNKLAAMLQNFKAIGLNIRHVPANERGRAKGVNRGLAHVGTILVGITDDDCFVANDWTENMAGQLRGSERKVVTGRIEATGVERIPVTVTSITPASYRRPSLLFDRLSGGNMGTTMAVFEHVGYFDEDVRLTTAEDGEWAYRALRAGISLFYAPNIVVRHYGWRDESKRYDQYRHYARSHGGFYGKYLRKGDWFILARVLVHFLRCLKRWIRGVVLRDEETRLYGYAYLTGLLPGILAGLRREEI